MRDAFVNQLTELARHDSDIMFLTGDLGFGVFDNFAKEFPDQYIRLLCGVGQGHKNASHSISPVFPIQMTR